jgi:hypothetical protein
MLHHTDDIGLNSLNRRGSYEAEALLIHIATQTCDFHREGRCVCVCARMASPRRALEVGWAGLE